MADGRHHSGSLVVLTALEVEYLAVRAHLSDLRPYRHGSGTRFEVGRLDGTGWQVALAELGEGNQGAAALTERAVAVFDPRAVAFVGVAGGLKQDVRLGDVVVATHVYAYHGGKDEDGEFLARPRVWALSHELEQTAKAVRRDGAWGGSLPAGVREGPPAVHLKPVAAGEVVLNSAASPLRRQLRRTYQDAAAIEMEAAGVAQAAHLNASLPALIVRGISDHADGRKSDTDAEGWQAVAARNAAAFAFRVLRALDPPDGPTGAGRPGPEPQGAGPGGSGPGDGPGDPAAYRQLQRWSRRFSDDLDVVDSRPPAEGGDDAPSHLSEGLYVRRAAQDRVVAALHGADPKPVLVRGEAGHGKSSLLWGVARELAAPRDAEVFLVNAAWLLHPAAGSPGALSPPAVVDAAVHARARGRSPVVLLDTADLLLHDDRHEMVLLDLCDDLVAAGARLVLTSRPEEAKRLRAGFTAITLGPYDDHEIPHAIRGHAAHYCPDAAPRDDAARVRRLMEPVTRGLPVREVCRSPLHLRLLFELARDDRAFPSAEIDVTGLYQRYWNHRVVADRRALPDRRPGRPADTGEDLSEATGAVAVALMSAGRTELPREDLVELLTSAHGGPGPLPPCTPSGAHADLDRLLARGVLAAGADGGVRFFHQTMFEYAAARGMFRHRGPRALEWLCAWIERHERDFFVGAILEQLLMLAAAYERHRPAVQDTLARMVSRPDAVVLHSIAVAVAARNPAVGPPVGPLLDRAPHTVSRRYAVLAPSVRDADVGTILPHLRGLWERKEPSLQVAVLEALERLAAQDAPAVHAALTGWGCLPELLGRRRNTVGVEVVPRLLVLTAHVDAAAARQGFRDVLDFAFAARLAELAHAVMALWARHWRLLGSPREADAVRDRVVRARAAPKSRDAELFQTALGEVLAASWTVDHRLPGAAPSAADGHPWPYRLDRCAARLEADHQDPVANAELFATTTVLDGLPAGHWAVEPTLDRLLALTGQGAPRALQQQAALPRLLAGRSAAAEALVRRLGALLRGLPSDESRSLTTSQRWAAVAREILAQRNVPPRRVRQTLESSGWAPAPDLWLRPDGLAKLLLPAALADHPPAVRGISEATAAPPAARAFVRRSLHRAVADGRTAAEQHTGLLVDLCLLDADTVLLEAVTTGRAKKGTSALPPPAHDRVLSTLRGSAPALTALIDAELDHGGSGKRLRQALTLWECSVLAGVLPPPEVDRLLRRYDALSDQKSQAAFLGLVGTAAARDPGQYPAAHRFLSGLLYAPDGALAPLRGVPDGERRSAARRALLHAACETGSLAEDAVYAAIGLAFAPPTDAGLITHLGQLVRRTAAAHGPVPAARLLVRVIRRAVGSGQGAAAENHLSKAFRGAMDSVFDRGSPAANALLWDHLRATGENAAGEHFVFPERYALSLVSSAIRRAYETTRQPLEDLLADPRTPQSVRKRISDQLGARHRQRTDQDLTWILGDDGPP
ncbi:5'-methylthioadenosine/S-adenosylhomocysteine nucleosidase [Streptomyces sp. B1866]|uniref:5'-methylthioadenosine/S-adenosylhomocysteine nucleosidase n=1 Tax=Streptomyces sp. B1866 TaxID=3075431 RepID=UPI00288E1000|nr:5'-methylthioadenosine/S-adenosylhomocysteine nucleosidase [Streptomyces sp. B1866]MDT3395735.1 5'-methylthioadenosine/S-adenosylhomocysteine nucleosidase [Streptomyces sp. B1866]